MRLVRLAKLLELKYNLKSEAASIQDVINDIKKDIISAYTLYVNPKTAKEPALQMFADGGEPHCAKIVAYMTAMVAKIDTLAATPSHLFRAVNKILELCTLLDKELRGDKSSPNRLPGQSTLNQLHNHKRKLGTVLQRLSSILAKQAKLLRKFMPEESPLAGDATVPIPQPLSKDQLFMFMHTPAAQSFGLDNYDVMTQIQQYPELREQVRKIVNSINRGHNPSSPEIMKEVQAIKEWLNRTQITNLPALEQTPEKPPTDTSLFEDEPQ